MNPSSPFAKDYYEDYLEDEDLVDDGFQRDRIMELKKILSEYPESLFPTEYHQLIRRILKNMCKLCPIEAMTLLSDECRNLLKEKLLPACRGKHGNLFLKELSNSWSIHKELVRAIHRVYAQLGDNHEASTDFKKIEVNMFYDMFSEEFEVKLWDTVYSLIDEDLAWMYMLLSDIAQGLHTLSCVVKQHIIDEVTPILKKAEDMENNNQAKRRDVLDFQKLIMLDLIALHDKHLKYSEDCGNSKDLDRALGKAYEAIFNRVVTTSFSAEFLATFCDDFIKNYELSDVAFHATLEKVLGFVSYVENKILFAELYRIKLARTLLSRRIGNFTLHRDFLTLLEIHLGSLYTSKMKKMVDDVTSAEEAHQSFNDYLSKNPNVNLGLHFRVTMLNSESWPTQECYDLKLPDEMVKCLEVYKEFYNKRPAKKKVNWIFSLGTVDLVVNFDSGPIEFEMTTIQTCVIVLFDSSNKLSYEEIKNQLNVSDDDYIVRVLQSLTCAEYQILTKDPSTKIISQNDYFELNSNFTSEYRKITIPPPEENYADEKILVARYANECMVSKYTINACIVRLMKRDRRMPFTGLKALCETELSSKFMIKQFKERIENLCDLNYIARDENDANIIVYLP